MVKKVQAKITELQKTEEDKGGSSIKATLEYVLPQEIVKKDSFTWKKETSSNLLKENESKAKSRKQPSKSGQMEEFDEGEIVDYYDIHSKHCVNAVIVRRITFGQYAIRVNNRVLLRKAFFLTKKSV